VCDDRVLTCVYCGQEYPRGTPRSQHELLYEHIAQCPKHPLSKAVQFIKDLQYVLRNQSEPGFNHDLGEWIEQLHEEIAEFLFGLGVEDGSN